MGAGSSMSMFSNMTEKEYLDAASQLPSVSSPPTYAAALELALKFGSFSLDDDDAKCCEGCGRGLRGRGFSMDLLTDEPSSSSEFKQGDFAEEKGGGLEEEEDPKDLKDAPFMYEGLGYCNLECFFSAHSHKPMLCAYVDKVATIAFQFSKKKAAYGRK